MAFFRALLEVKAEPFGVPLAHVLARWPVSGFPGHGGLPRTGVIDVDRSCFRRSFFHRFSFCPHPSLEEFLVASVVASLICHASVLGGAYHTDDASGLSSFSTAHPGACACDSVYASRIPIETETETAAYL